MYTEDDLLPLSALADLAFCERRAALHHIEQVWEDNLFTVEGTLMHDKVHAKKPTEVRGNVRIARGLRLRSLKLGLTARADVVEFHRAALLGAPAISGPQSKLRHPRSAIELPGVAGRWQPFPVEYKRGRLRHEKGFEIQLCAQAVCLEEMLDVVVPRGAIFYGKTERRLEVEFDASLRSGTEAAAARLHMLFDFGITPQAPYGKKCNSCSLVDLCMPRATSGARSAAAYFMRMIEE